MSAPPAGLLTHILVDIGRAPDVRGDNGIVEGLAQGLHREHFFHIPERLPGMDRMCLAESVRVLAFFHVER